MDRGFNGDLMHCILLHDTHLPSALRIDPSGYTNRALRKACASGNEALVELLLRDTRVDISAMEYEAVRLAVRFENKGVVKLLTNDQTRPLIELIYKEYSHLFA